MSAGWWVLVVELWPAADRPYIGGSQDNSVLELVFGYNGFGRLTGDEVGSVGGAPGGGWGSTGLTRLFGSEFGGQAAWLLPAALLALGALLWWTRRAPRGDALRAAALVWGGWLVVTGLTFSLMAGIIHPYYVVVLAPPIAALVGLGGAVAWRDRARPGVRLLLAGGVAVTAAWAFVLLRRTPSWQPWLAWTVLGLGVVAVVGLLVVEPRAAGARRGRARGGPGGRAGGTDRLRDRDGRDGAHGSDPVGGAVGWHGAGWVRPGRPRRRPVGAARLGRGRRRRSWRGGRGGRRGSAAGATGGGMGRGGPGGFGGLLGSPTPSTQVVALLQRDAGEFTWAAAAVGSNTAAGYQLATQLPVMAVGGFNGTDPAPTLAQFQELVAAKKIHWFVGGGAGSARSQSGGSDDAAEIAAWVRQHYTPTTVGGTTLYDLSGAAS